MKITIIYDNETDKKDLKADWGFSCLVEAGERKILFDTGANGSILLANMKKLNIEPATIQEIFISHDHWDHTGGLSDFLSLHPARVYLPSSCEFSDSRAEIIRIKEPCEIHQNIFSTGELKNIEQSLFVKTEKGLVGIVGCSHPGIKSILQAASQFGKTEVLIGGLHGFSDFDAIKDLKLICPTHCTQFKSQIKALYPEKCVKGGAGKIIQI